MVHGFENWFRQKSMLTCFLTGCGFIILFSIPLLVTGDGSWAAFPFKSYLPFHIWLVLTGLLVMLSRDARIFFLGEDLGSIYSIFARLFSNYGVFCLGGFITVGLTWALAGIAR